MTRPPDKAHSWFLTLVCVALLLLSLLRWDQHVSTPLIRVSAAQTVAPMSGLLAQRSGTVFHPFKPREATRLPLNEVTISLTTYIAPSMHQRSRIRRADIDLHPVLFNLDSEPPAIEHSGLSPESVQQLLSPFHMLTPEQAYRLYLYGDECFQKVSTQQDYLVSMDRVEATVLSTHQRAGFNPQYWLDQLDELEQNYRHCQGYVSPDWEVWNEQQFNWLTHAASGGVDLAMHDYYDNGLALLTDEPDLMVRQPHITARYRQTALASLNALILSSPEAGWLQWSEAFTEGLIINRDPIRSFASLMLASLHSDDPTQYDDRVSQMIEQLGDAQIRRADRWVVEQMIRTINSESNL